MSAVGAPAAVREPLPLPPVGWGADQARAALLAARDQLPEAVAAAAGTQSAELVSALTTVVLRVGGWAVKVYPPGTSTAHLDRIREALLGSHCASVACAPAVDTADGVVTASRWLTATSSMTWSELGSLLARFHSEHAGAPLPVWTPLSRLPGQVVDLPRDHASVLLTAREQLLGALAEVRLVLGVGPIHGDVSLLNVMRDGSTPVLIDLDWAASGPREYDLAGAARRLRTGDMTDEQYRGFCAGYGFDVRDWDGLAVLDRISALGAVAFRLWDDRHHGRSLAWVSQEVPRWRQPL